jgi:16S rRNA processing protein RimM
VSLAQFELLAVGTLVEVAGRRVRVVRRAGTAQRPVLRLEGLQRREDAEALRGAELQVDLENAPQLGPDEYWAHELEGCVVHDGGREVGVVQRLMALPSCEALEVRRAQGPDLLVPLVHDAVRAVDVAGRRVDVDLRFLGVEERG